MAGFMTNDQQMYNKWRFIEFMDKMTEFWAFMFGIHRMVDLFIFCTSVLSAHRMLAFLNGAQHVTPKAMVYFYVAKIGRMQIEDREVINRMLPTYFFTFFFMWTFVSPRLLHGVRRPVVFL